MDETVIADFRARFVVEATPGSEPVQGRVILSQKRLVMASNEAKSTIPLQTIFDISVGYVPPKLEKFFRDTVTIAYENDDGRTVVFLEAGSDEVKRFKTLLFKALLNKTSVFVKHPARIGGRVTDRSFGPASMVVDPGRVSFGETADPFTIELPTVTHFEKIERELGGTKRPIISVRHVDGGQSVTSEIAMDSSRKMSVFGRYVRLEYSEAKSELSRIDVSDEEMETLVALYSHGDTMSVAKVLGKDTSRVTMLLNDLQRKGLLEEDASGMSVTTQGQMLVSKRIEDVNA